MCAFSMLPTFYFVWSPSYERCTSRTGVNWWFELYCLLPSNPNFSRARSANFPVLSFQVYPIEGLIRTFYHFPQLIGSISSKSFYNRCLYYFISVLYSRIFDQKWVKVTYVMTCRFHCLQYAGRILGNNSELTGGVKQFVMKLWF